jgi:putative sigma-54 modulation protein
MRENPQVIKSVKFDAKPISLEEATLEIRSTKNNFLVFRNALNEKINILYHRNDGNLGLIDTD